MSWICSPVRDIRLLVRRSFPEATCRGSDLASCTPRASFPGEQRGAGEDYSLDWDDLKIVLAVSRTGSLTRAALELGIKLGRVHYGVYAQVGWDAERPDWVGLLDEEIPRLAPTRATDRLRGRGGLLRMKAPGINVLLAFVALDCIVSAADIHRIVPFDGHDKIVAAIDVIVPGAADVEDVAAGLAPGLVVAGPQNDLVVAPTSSEVVIARSTVDEVVASPTIDRIVAPFTVEQVAVGAAFDGIVAGRHGDVVVSIQALERVGVAGVDNHVVAICAGEVLNGVQLVGLVDLAAAIRGLGQPRPEISLQTGRSQFMADRIRTAAAVDRKVRESRPERVPTAPVPGNHVVFALYVNTGPEEMRVGCAIGQCLGSIGRIIVARVC